jgi:hypothetical protein
MSKYHHKTRGQIWKARGFGKSDFLSETKLTEVLENDWKRRIELIINEITNLKLSPEEKLGEWKRNYLYNLKQNNYFKSRN